MQHMHDDDYHATKSNNPGVRFYVPTRVVPSGHPFPHLPLLHILGSLLYQDPSPAIRGPRMPESPTHVLAYKSSRSNRLLVGPLDFNSDALVWHVSHIRCEGLDVVR